MSCLHMCWGCIICLLYNPLQLLSNHTSHFLAGNAFLGFSHWVFGVCYCHFCFPTFSLYDKLFLYVCVCMCQWERDRERETERKRESAICVCVYVWVKGREREICVCVNTCGLSFFDILEMRCDEISTGRSYFERENRGGSQCREMHSPALILRISIMFLMSSGCAWLMVTVIFLWVTWCISRD